MILLSTKNQAANAAIVGTNFNISNAELKNTLLALVIEATSPVHTSTAQELLIVNQDNIAIVENQRAVIILNIL